MENILEICEVLLENMLGMMKLSRDISSRRLFCSGVPVRRRRYLAYGGDKHATRTLIKTLWTDRHSSQTSRHAFLVITALTLMPMRWR